MKREWSEEPKEIEFVPVKQEPEELGSRRVIGPEDFVAVLPCNCALAVQGYRGRGGLDDGEGSCLQPDASHLEGSNPADKEMPSSYIRLGRAIFASLRNNKGDTLACFAIRKPAGQKIMPIDFISLMPTDRGGGQGVLLDPAQQPPVLSTTPMASPSARPPTPQPCWCPGSATKKKMLEDEHNQLTFRKVIICRSTSLPLNGAAAHAGTRAAAGVHPELLPATTPTCAAGEGGISWLLADGHQLRRRSTGKVALGLDYLIYFLSDSSSPRRNRSGGAISVWATILSVDLVLVLFGSNV
uniref:Uncharacterized protein n=1 Tax=Aegilops tauschii TaxID=37682 RepID=M8BKG7_AEGTA